MQVQQIDNFGKNVRSTPAVYARPQNVKEILQLLAQHHDKNIRVVGSRHAWSNGIATDGLLINVENLTHIKVNADAMTVRVGAGCQVKSLLAELKKYQLTLPSVGLIDEQTVAGATATGTHGSGKHCMSHYVVRVWVAHFDPESDEPTVSEIDSGTDLQAAQCSLGLLGVVVELEFELRPVYRVQEHSAKHVSLADVLEAEQDFPLQQFFLIPWSWDWYGQHRVETMHPVSRASQAYRIYWHLGIDWGLHLVVLALQKVLRSSFLVSSFYRYLLPVVFLRNWKVVDDSESMLTMEHELFRHIEIELFVKRSQLPAALDHVKSTMIYFAGKSGDWPMDDLPQKPVTTYFHHYPICVRRVLVDDTLVSATSAVRDGDVEDWYAISCISYDSPNRRDGFWEFAQYLASSTQIRFDARCHWGKYYPPESRQQVDLYPRIETFRAVVKRFDARGRFASSWLRRVMLLNE